MRTSVFFTLASLTLISCKAFKKPLVVDSQAEQSVQERKTHKGWAQEDLDPKLLYLRNDNVEDVILVSPDATNGGQVPLEEQITVEHKCQIPASAFPLKLALPLDDIVKADEEGYHLHYYFVQLEAEPAPTSKPGFANTDKPCPYKSGFVRFFKIKHAISEKTPPPVEAVSDQEISNLVQASLSEYTVDFNPQITMPGQQSTTATKLLQFYSSKTGYQKVAKSVLEFYKDGPHYGCVAYASTALRYVGVKIPFTIDDYGDNVSTVTRPFRNYLSKQLHWPIVKNLNDLRPGDIAFSTDEKGWPDFPAHVYVFVKWHNQDCSIAMVIDNYESGPQMRNMKWGNEVANRGCSYQKFLSLYGGRKVKSPFQYGYRPL